MVRHETSVFLLFSLFAAVGVAPAEPAVDRYNVVWDSPSRDSSGSMPVGNGDIGLNVWVEEDGDLFFCIGKTDSWSENARLLKLGRVRIHLTPNPFRKGFPFLQTLSLRDASILIAAGAPPEAVDLRIWVDANAPVVHVEAEGKTPFDIQVSLETWRTESRQLESTREIHSAYGLSKAPFPVVVKPDTILKSRKGQIVWYHRNESSIWAETLKLQGLAGYISQWSDPLLYRTFGGAIRGQEFISVNSTILRAKEARPRHTVSVHLLTAQTGSAAEWVERLEETIEKNDAVPPEVAWAKHAEWWAAFWNRSWIHLVGAEAASVREDETFEVSRGYTLHRFMTACGGRGAYPIKFNGSIFTVQPYALNDRPADSRESADETFDPDYRRWGGPYWFQNTRLIYWPMLASGDFEMMQPLFQMYLDTLPLARIRTKIYFQHDGVFFPETIYFWGAYANDNFGWEREGKHVSHVDNRYIRYYYSDVLELLAMMLDYHAFSGDGKFLRSRFLPLADAALRFYDLHYPRGADGKIRFEPAQSLETWWECVNPMPEIAGLRFVLGKLMCLPEHITTAKQREAWERLLNELPPVPTREVNGQTILSPAEEFADKHNIENPELYAVFPYRLYGVGKPDLEMAQRTFEHRLHIEGNFGHDQDDAHAAYLGLTDQVREFIVRRFGSKYLVARFPAFWHGGYDWPPDQCHGGNGMIALQAMLMQCEGDKILLFPAWPKEWDVEFKLHAPNKTTVQGVYRNGELKSLEVTPASRAKDVTVTDPR